MPKRYRLKVEYTTSFDVDASSPAEAAERFGEWWEAEVSIVCDPPPQGIKPAFEGKSQTDVTVWGVKE